MGTTTLERPVISRRPIEEQHPNGRAIRSDALPDHVGFHDGGCSFAPECLRCPLERCVYELPGGVRRALADSRDEALLLRRRNGAAIDALAREFRISRRSVFRVLAKAREA